MLECMNVILLHSNHRHVSAPYKTIFRVVRTRIHLILYGPCIILQYICKPTRYTTFYDWVYSQNLVARHVSVLNGPPSEAFTSCMLQIWYVVICVLLDTSRCYAVAYTYIYIHTYTLEILVLLIMKTAQVLELLTVCHSLCYSVLYKAPVVIHNWVLKHKVTTYTKIGFHGRCFWAAAVVCDMWRTEWEQKPH